MPNSCNYQVSDQADSLSLPSEPPDVRNWFSSYAYESPELNTYENWDDSAARVNDRLEEAVYDGERGKQEGEENKVERTTRNNDRLVPAEVDSNETTEYKNTAQDCCHRKAIEGLDSLSDLLSLSPEPPHVERWFSSYVYESPLLDTNIDCSPESKFPEFDGAGRYTEKCCEEKESDLGNLESTVEKNFLPTTEKSFLHGLATCGNSVKDTNSQLQCADKAVIAIAVNGSDPIALPNKKNREHILKIKLTQDHNIASAPIRKRDLDGEDFISREELNNGSSGKSGNSPDKLAQRSGLLRGPARTENLVNLTSGSADKENKGNSFQENGFVSTRKKRSGLTSGASSLRRSVPLDASIEYLAEQKPFSERTNFLHTVGFEITGKWKCPRKSKPNLGPPLKQLRLEQWVNRM